MSSVGFEAIQSAVMIERSEGKAHFASEDFPEAEERYKVALRLLETTADETTGVKEELLTVLRLNRDELDGWSCCDVAHPLLSDSFPLRIVAVSHNNDAKFQSAMPDQDGASR